MYKYAEFVIKNVNSLSRVWVGTGQVFPYTAKGVIAAQLTMLELKWY